MKGVLAMAAALALLTLTAVIGVETMAVIDAAQQEE